MPTPETKRVCVLGVDAMTGFAMVRDTLGAEFQVNYRVRPKGSAEPAVDEIWIVNRQPGGQWFLGSQVGNAPTPSVTGTTTFQTDPVLSSLLGVLTGAGLVLDQTEAGTPSPPVVTGVVKSTETVFKSLLTTLDTAGVIDDQTTVSTASTEPYLPFRMAAGEHSIPSLGAYGEYTKNISFPSGRFTQTPKVVVGGEINPNVVASIYPDSVTTSGFTSWSYNHNGVTGGYSGYFHWIAIQMTSGSGGG